MKTKKDIVENWLVRYTGQELADLGDYILLTNFDHYIDEFIGGENMAGFDRQSGLRHIHDRGRVSRPVIPKNDVLDSF